MQANGAGTRPVFEDRQLGCQDRSVSDEERASIRRVELAFEAIQSQEDRFPRARGMQRTLISQAPHGASLDDSSPAEIPRDWVASEADRRAQSATATARTAIGALDDIQFPKRLAMLVVVSPGQG